MERQPGIGDKLRGFVGEHLFRREQGRLFDPFLLEAQEAKRREIAHEEAERLQAEFVDDPDGMPESVVDAIVQDEEAARF